MNKEIRDTSILIGVVIVIFVLFMIGIGLKTGEFNILRLFSYNQCSPGDTTWVLAGSGVGKTFYCELEPDMEDLNWKLDHCEVHYTDQYGYSGVLTITEGKTARCSTSYQRCTFYKYYNCGIECISHYEIKCYQGHPAWFDSCGHYENTYEWCSSDEICKDGECVPKCTSHYEKKCYNDDVYWYDSCGNREERYEDCSYGCSNGQCISANPANIKIYSFTAPSSANEGDSVTATITVKNYGDLAGTTNVEYCIFPDKWGGSTYSLFSTVQPIAKCCPGNEFCEAVRISSLPGGSSKTFSITVKAPSQTSYDHCDPAQRSAWDNSFFSIVGTYDQCGQAYNSYKTKNIEISGPPHINVEILEFLSKSGSLLSIASIIGGIILII